GTPMDLFDLRSDELEEIIGYAPSGLIRWGISAICLTLLTLLAISWFVEYPELVRGEMSVTTPRPPIRLVSRINGEIESLFVAAGERVEEGAHLLLLETAADLDSILRLSEQLEVFERASSRTELAEAAEQLPGPHRFTDPKLGRIQREHSAFAKSLSDYLELLEADYYGQKIRALEAQVDKHLELRAAIQSQLGLSNEQLELAERQRVRQLQLAREGLLSEMDQEQAESDYLEMRTSIEGDVRDLASSDVIAAEYQGALLELRHRAQEEERQLELELRGRLNDLRGAIRVWKQDFLFQAPVAGTVSFLRVLDESHFVAAGEPVTAVGPDGPPAYVQMHRPQSGAGRVKVGQPAILRFDSYPSNEFGSVHGEVESISLVPSRQADSEEPVYLVSISLPEGLVTSYGRQLGFRQEMGGAAEIVTEDLRLLERLFYRLRDILR
ncbi:MAG: HlyD family secretion protein, partial [Holophagales bacterium]|nr:HlyD family secretion protein [Holophagales bacterium]